jgi:ElaB/YqjD/DUF883 family membrane-anchored ribosome-binding protein
LIGVAFTFTEAQIGNAPEYPLSDPEKLCPTTSQYRLLVLCRAGPRRVGRHTLRDQIATAGGFMDQAKAQGSSKGGSFPNNSPESVANSINRGKEAVTTAASEAVDAGGAALKALQSDLSDLKETVDKLISRGSNETAKSAREVAGQVSTAASDIADRGANVASAVTDQAKTLVTELENIARRNPLGALASAVVVGILIGMMGRRN